jgi:hypothetical protein
MLDGLSRNSCLNSAKIQFLCHSMLFGNLGMHASAPRNFCCCLFSSARPLSCSLLFSQQEIFSSSLVLSTRLLFLPLALGISPKSLLASHQDFFHSFLFFFFLLFSQQECCNFLVLGISPRTSWHLTKNLLLSQQDCCCLLLASHQESLGISPRFLQLLLLPKNGCAHLP